MSHLKGYRESRPVRSGNKAVTQLQLDSFGEVLNSGLILAEQQHLDLQYWTFFKKIGSLVAKSWRKPDNGIWEHRGKRQNFVYSKVMCWVALDRCIKLALKHKFHAPLARWEAERQAIFKDVLKKGYDTSRGTFVSVYGGREPDASVLRMGLLGFLPILDPRFQSTMEYCRDHLVVNGFMLRYRRQKKEEREGAFVLCNFWLIECLALSGRVKEAESLLNTTLRASNHLGLFSEEFDPITNTMLGNLPQAYSHIGLINARQAIVNASRLEKN